MAFSQRSLIDDFPFDDILALESNSSQYNEDQYININYPADESLNVNTNISSVASSSATYVSSGCNSNSDSNGLVTERRGSLPSAQQPTNGRTGETCFCGVSASDEACPSCQMAADLPGLIGSQPSAYSSNLNSTNPEMRTPVNLNNSANHLALMNSNYPANGMGNVSMNHNPNLSKNQANGPLYGHPIGSMNSQMSNNQMNNQMNALNQMNNQIGNQIASGQMGYGHMNGHVNASQLNSPTHHHAYVNSHMAAGNQRMPAARMLAKQQVPYGALQICGAAEDKPRKRSLDGDEPTMKKMRPDHLPLANLNDSYMSGVGDNCFGSPTAGHETHHSQSYSRFSSQQYGGPQAACQQQQANLAVCQQQGQSNYKLTDLSAVQPYDANNNIGHQYASNRNSISMLHPANGYVQSLNSGAPLAKSNALKNRAIPLGWNDVTSSQNSIGITQGSDQSSPHNSTNAAQTPLDGTHNLSDEAQDTNDTMASGGQICVYQSDVPRKLVEAIVKQRTNNPSKRHTKKASYFDYKDILALRLSEYETSEEKISRLFLYLNEKLGIHPNNQQFEFGSALSTAVTLNPELADDSGCGTHTLRTMFTETRNVFMNHLHLKKPAKEPRTPAEFSPKNSLIVSLKESPKSSPKSSQKISPKISPKSSPKSSPKGSPKSSPKSNPPENTTKKKRATKAKTTKAKNQAKTDPATQSPSSSSPITSNPVTPSSASIDPQQSPQSSLSASLPPTKIQPQSQTQSQSQNVPTSEQPNLVVSQPPLAIEHQTQQVQQLPSFQHMSTVQAPPTAVYGQIPSQMYIHTAAAQVYGLSNQANDSPNGQQFHPYQVQILAVNRSGPDTDQSTVHSDSAT